MLQILVGDYHRILPTFSFLVVKEIGLSEAKDDFLNGLVDHCKIEKPDTVQLPKVFKMLYSSLPMDELTGCVEKCATELHRNSPVSCVESFLTGLVNEVRRR